MWRQCLREAGRGQGEWRYLKVCLPIPWKLWEVRGTGRGNKEPHPGLPHTERGQHGWGRTGRPSSALTEESLHAHPWWGRSLFIWLNSQVLLWEVVNIMKRKTCLSSNFSGQVSYWGCWKPLLHPHIQPGTMVWLALERWGWGGRSWSHSVGRAQEREKGLSCWNWHISRHKI